MLDRSNITIIASQAIVSIRSTLAGGEYHGRCQISLAIVSLQHIQPLRSHIEKEIGMNSCEREYSCHNSRSSWHELIVTHSHSHMSKRLPAHTQISATHRCCMFVSFRFVVFIRRLQ